MIRQIKSYLKKYHEANLWIAKRTIFEEKKQAIQHTDVSKPVAYDYIQPVLEQQQVVFTHYDTGHNEEENSKIQHVYEELADIFRGQRLAV